MAKNKNLPPMLPHIEALETSEGVDPMEVMPNELVYHQKKSSV